MLTINYLPQSNEGPRKQYILNETYLGPFSYLNKSSLKSHMHDVLSFEVQYEISNRIPNHGTS